MRGACTLIVSAASLWLLAASAYDAASPLQAVIRPGTIPLDTNGKEVASGALDRITLFAKFRLTFLHNLALTKVA